MSIQDPTYIGQVASVVGSIVRIRLRDDMPTTLVLIEGESYRIGQTGAFVRIPLGYTHLYAICTQVGADAVPTNIQALAPMLGVEESPERLAGYRWMTAVLFGESIGRQFSRGVGQNPTVGDEVHVVTNRDLRVIYGSLPEQGAIQVGSVASSGGIPARVDIAALVTRHCSIVGSTGAGKSNLVTILVNEMASQGFPGSRIVIIDPHGEYAAALGNRARVFKPGASGTNPDEKELWVPFWALGHSDLLAIVMSGMQPNVEADIREMVLERKKAAAAHLSPPPPIESITADSPIPFSLRKLWFDLDDFERITFTKTSPQDESTKTSLVTAGDPTRLLSNGYEPATSYNTPPYQNQRARRIGRQLDLLKNRLQDSRFNFLLNPGNGFEPDLNGRIQKDLDTLLQDWLGHDRPVTIFDTSEVPSAIENLVVATVLDVIYDSLFWAMNLPVGGRKRPVLIVLEEAHRFVSEGKETPANNVVNKIAKEGRKYGVGLMIVSQRPSDVDAGILSQCGTMISLRVSNPSDRSRVSSTIPDDLGGLADVLPTLRTGEGLFMGEALLIPTRVRVTQAPRRPIGDDPALVESWRKQPSLELEHFSKAVVNWRSETNIETEGSQVEQSEED